MGKNKLVRLSRFLLFLLILVFIFAFFIWPKLVQKDKLGEKGEEGISTNTPFKASDYDNGKMVQDYSNPTDEERWAVNQKYGVGYSYFDEEGLHLVNIADVYAYEEDRLITDKWPEHEYTNAVLKPDLEIREIVVAETYLEIHVKDVSKKDLEKYIKQVKDEYKNEVASVIPNTLYRAYNDDDVLLSVMWKEEQGVIEYRFK